MDKKFKVNARPLNLLVEQSYSFIHFFLMRCTPYLTYLLVKHSNIKPNTISIISILFLILSFLSLIYRNYSLAFFLLLLNFVTDNIDGELARIKNQTSKLGEKLEISNSNIFYLFFFNIITYNFFVDEIISKNLFLALILISILHNLVRKRISYITLKHDFRFNKVNSIYLGLFKYSSKIRQKNLFSKIIYIFFFNIVFSGGISEIIIAILLILKSYELALIFLLFHYIVKIIYVTLLVSIKILYNILSK